MKADTTDGLTCPYCSSFGFPPTPDGKRARVLHLFDKHEDERPINWSKALRDHDEQVRKNTAGGGGGS